MSDTHSESDILVGFEAESNRIFPDDMMDESRFCSDTAADTE